MPGLITKRSKQRWQAAVVRNGQRYQQLFPDATKASERAANQWELEMIKNIKEEKIHTSCLVIFEWATEYLNYAQKNFVKKTYKEKTAVFKRIIQHLGNVSVDKVTIQKATSFLQKQFEVRSGYAANKDRKNLAAAWKWGRKYIDGFPEINLNPFSEAMKFREERQPRYIPPGKNFWKIYKISEGQDKVMLSAFLYLAARRKEIFNLKWSDVDFENNQVRLWTQKRQFTCFSVWIPQPLLISIMANLLR